MPQEIDAGVVVQEGALLELAAILADATTWSGAKLHLYQSTFTPNSHSVAADFAGAEGTFTGYAPVALTYSAVGLDFNGVPTSLSVRAFFQATDAVSPNTIGGCWVQADVVGPPAVHTVIRYYPFETPMNMADALDFIGVVLVIQDPSGPGLCIVDN